MVVADKLKKRGERPAEPTETSSGQETLIPNPAALGTLIRAQRKALDLSQQQVADVSGVSRKFMIELEHGKARAEIALVLKVAAALGLVLVARPR